MNPLQSIQQSARAGLLFLQRGLADFDTTASLVPSSRFLVRAMLEPLAREKPRCVVELGSGTGTLTREILDLLGPDGHVHAIELDGDLLATSVARLRDPRLRGLHGSAAETDALIDAECCGHVDAVVSSLGLSMMDEELRTEIVESARRVLRPEGVFTQYNYAHTRYLVVSPAKRSVTRWSAEPWLRRRFRSVERELVVLNVPPAFVYTCRG